MKDRGFETLKMEMRQELCNTMSAISEDCYCASWLDGLEYSLWAAMQYPNIPGELHGAMMEIDLEKLDRCRELSSALGGWIIWVSDLTDPPALPGEEWGPRFVTMDEWTAIRYAKP